MLKSILAFEFYSTNNSENKAIIPNKITNKNTPTDNGSFQNGNYHIRIVSRGFRIFVKEGVKIRWPENSLDNFFSLQLISILFQGFRGGSIFPEVGGLNAYYYRNTYNLSISGCDLDPHPPLDPCMLI